ncbi:MAG: DUF2817 domain-containing protein, partial [Acidobacteria bacterium]|nr:DUF2817 domain-containing protein [Acidobacteriota bacterium]
YDAFGELPAADDNASGVAGLIELAALLGKASLPLRVELVAYTLEEPKTIDGDGLFRTVGGSAVHAEFLKERGVQVRLMLSLEMIGYFSNAEGSQGYPSRIFRLFYPSPGNFLMVVGRLQDGVLARQVKKAMRSASPLPVYSLNAPASLEGIDWSDHYSYWKRDYPALMITDTALNRNREYHKAGDTADRLDFTRMAMVVQGVYAAVLQSAEDGSKESTVSEAAKYFSPDYITARTRFRQAVEKAGGRYYAIPLDAKGPANGDLTIDVGWIGSDHPKWVLLHSSGLHGVEGFAGSAIQFDLPDSVPKLPEETALVFAHVLNPYGMAWLRRFNENNVDLNRNFIGDGKYSGAPEAYPKLDWFLNPQRPPSSDFFLLKAGWLIVRYGYNALKQAIAGGQYEYPRGLFFGGKQLQPGPVKYQEFLAQRLSSAEQIAAIDVHTGLGSYGEDTLLVEQRNYIAAREVFGERVAPLSPENSPAYQTSGSIDTMLPRVFPKAKISFVCQEFGTYSAVKVLHALREENRWHHYGAGTPDHPTTQKLKEAFSPNDVSWKRSVLARGQELFHQAVELLLSEQEQMNGEAKSLEPRARR